MPLGSENIHSVFQVTLSQNGSLCGWSVRIWIGAGWEPSCAEECLDLSQNIIHLSGEQSLTAYSLNFTPFVEMGESATRHAILPMDFFLLS